jgi:inosine-uridine nucleoside N-ribohydrolase
MKRVSIDTDPDIDDTAAIFLALASPELHVEDPTTVGSHWRTAVLRRTAWRHADAL